MDKADQQLRAGTASDAAEGKRGKYIRVLRQPWGVEQRFLLRYIGSKEPAV